MATETYYVNAVQKGAAKSEVGWGIIDAEKGFQQSSTRFCNAC